MFEGLDISKMSQMMASMQEDMKRLQEDAKKQRIHSKSWWRYGKYHY